MAFFKNLLKKGNSEPPKNKPEVRETKSRSKDPEAPAQAAVSPVLNYRAGIGVVIAPHVSEKTAGGSRRGTYTFRIESMANKLEVKRAVENLYGVRVTSIRIVKARPKTRRLGGRMGVVPGHTKAVVQLAAGQSIEIGV
ncbi:MAG: 50S ribosomal protein L23 [Candidatus Sungbacteria bacterium]|uniref:Large ribosomal subunit protein uL23 n=1 Tax=Candidatus Sungiibacteriota bacterium TaxID=2750080 RepID=A0A931SAS7_9BACT|nr:50S ribosomal protein L23 [Candidatus Sungbacteria bacterium]